MARITKAEATLAMGELIGVLHVDGVALREHPELSITLYGAVGRAVAAVKDGTGGWDMPTLATPEDDTAIRHICDAIITLTRAANHFAAKNYPDAYLSAYNGIASARRANELLLRGFGVEENPRTIVHDEGDGETQDALDALWLVSRENNPRHDLFIEVYENIINARTVDELNCVRNVLWSDVSRIGRQNALAGDFLYALTQIAQLRTHKWMRDVGVYVDDTRQRAADSLNFIEAAIEKKGEGEGV